MTKSDFSGGDMREARKHDFMLFRLGSHVFQLVEWALVVGAVGFAAEKIQSDGLEALSFVLRGFVLLKTLEIVMLIGEHYKGIQTSKEFEEKYKGRWSNYMIVIMFFCYLAGLTIVSVPALLLTEELLEVARLLATQTGA